MSDHSNSNAAGCGDAIRSATAATSPPALSAPGVAAKLCPNCGKLFGRQFLKNGKLEPPSFFHKKRCCSQICGAIDYQNRRRAMGDDWEKTRGRNDHLTAEEIQQLRAAFNCGRKTADIARELKCSSRIAAKYYAQFRGKPNTPPSRPYERKPRPVVVRPILPETKASRFYKGNFDL